MPTVYWITGEDDVVATDIAIYDMSKKRSEVTDEEVRSVIGTREFDTEAEVSAFIQGLEAVGDYVLTRRFAAEDEAIASVREIVERMFDDADPEDGEADEEVILL